MVLVARERFSLRWVRRSSFAEILRRRISYELPSGIYSCRIKLSRYIPGLLAYQFAARQGDTTPRGIQVGVRPSGGSGSTFGSTVVVPPDISALVVHAVSQTTDLATEVRLAAIHS